METLKQTIRKYSSRKILPVYGFSLLFTFLFLIVPFEFANAGFKELMISAADVIFGNMFKFVGWILMKIASLITSLGGQFLDMIIRFTIDGTNLQLSGVFQGWTIFRDLVNMLFIFILLYVSFMTVLQGASFGTRKILANVIIVGLFINFSYFLTGFVIDIGNSLSAVLYASITPTPGSGAGGILIDRMNLASLKEVAANASNFSTGIVYMFNALFFTIAGFVFFAGGMLFLSRHVSLIFVLMLSPLAFGAYILPNTKKHFSKWLSTLIGSTFVAPAYLLMLAVTIAIASSGDLFGNAQGANIQGGTSGEISFPFLDNPGLLLNYLVIIGLLIGSLTVAKNISSGLAGSATSWAGKALGMGAGVAGFAGRQTAGRVGRRLANSERFKDYAVSDNRAVRTFGSLSLKAGKASSNASFDARAGKVGSFVGGTAGAALGAGGVNVNVGRASGQGGYEKIRKEKIEKQVATARDLGETKVTKMDSEKYRTAKEKHDEVVSKAKAREKILKTIANNSKDGTTFKPAQRERAKQQLKIEKAKAKANIKEAKANLKAAGKIASEDTIINSQDTAEERAKKNKERAAREKYAGERGIKRVVNRADYLDSRKHFTWSRESRSSGKEAARTLRKKETNYDKLLKKLKKDSEKDSGESTPNETKEAA